MLRILLPAAHSMTLFWLLSVLKQGLLLARLLISLELRLTENTMLHQVHIKTKLVRKAVLTNSVDYLWCWRLWYPLFHLELADTKKAFKGLFIAFTEAFGGWFRLHWLLFLLRELLFSAISSIFDLLLHVYFLLLIRLLRWFSLALTLLVFALSWHSLWSLGKVGAIIVDQFTTLRFALYLPLFFLIDKWFVVFVGLRLVAFSFLMWTTSNKMLLLSFLRILSISGLLFRVFGYLCWTHHTSIVLLFASERTSRLTSFSIRSTKVSCRVQILIQVIIVHIVWLAGSHTETGIWVRNASI